MSRPPRLAARDVTVRYGNFEALRRISVEFLPGEVHAVVGQNGAGKSTLMRVLAGEEQPLAGEVSVDGVAATLGSPLQARQRGISIVHQHFELAPGLSVAENMALGQTPTRARWFIDRDAVRRLAQERLAPFGLAHHADTRVRDLPMAERQLVEIGRALGEQGRVLILDEPTAALSHEEAERLFDTVREIRARGGCVILIAHSLEEVLGVADRITVLRGGERVATVDRRDVDRAQLVRLMIGHDLESSFPEPRRRAAPVRAAVTIGGLITSETASPMRIELNREEVLGMPTYIGAAVEEVLEVVNGSETLPGVEVRHGDIDVSSKSQRERITRGICTVPGDALKEGVVPQLSIAENIALANRRRLGRAGWLDRRAARRLADHLIKELDIRPADADTPVHLLSGGNRQKVVIAKWLASGAAVLLMDDPTKAVDVAAKADIYRLTRKVASNGTAVLFLSTDLDELVGLCDRIVVLHQRRCLGVRDAPPFDKADLMHLITGRQSARAADMASSSVH